MLIISHYILTYRPINNVLGFSRETLLAVITNIEGREWSRRLNKLGKAENPRASTSDDVECLFSMMRDAIGQHFTAKQVQIGFRKVALELEKHLDPELPLHLTIHVIQKAPYQTSTYLHKDPSGRTRGYQDVNFLQLFP